MDAGKLTRRSWMLRAVWATTGTLAADTAFTQSAVPSGPPRPEAYAMDVDFLLFALEKRAGHFFRTKKIDWVKVSQQFRQEVTRVTSDVEHVRLCQRLIARLRDGHAELRFLKVSLPDESAGRVWCSPGINLVVIGDKVHVRHVMTPAARAMVSPGQELQAIEGKPARQWLNERVAQLSDENGYSTDHQALYAACHWGLGGWSGTEFTVEVSGPDLKSPLTLHRDGSAPVAPIGPLFPPRELQSTGRQSFGRTMTGLGYIHLRDVPAELPRQLDVMLGSIGKMRGLILDLRANGGGGCDHGEVFARFVGRGRTWKQYRGGGTDPFDGPLVLIVDAGTRSAGETIAGMLKEDGRAYVLGDTPTAGTSSQKLATEVPSRLFSVYFSVASNMARLNGGRGIEGIGVPPHAVVPYRAADLLSGVDTPLRKADALIDEGLPVKAVPYSVGRGEA